MHTYIHTYTYTQLQVPQSKLLTKSQIRTLAVSFFDSPDRARSYIRRDEFRALGETHVCSSMFLSGIFDVPTRFDNLSEFMRKSIGPLQKLQRGIVRSSQFVSMFNKSATTFRPLLNPGLKSIFHKRALRRGEKDPLKTDYSKLVPNRTRRGRGVVSELLHGQYGNRAWHNYLKKRRAAEMLQSVVRSRKARKIARVTFERRALQTALDTAKKRAADAVDNEFARKESLPKLKKIKWAAKIRMYQVKARTKGVRLSREECVEEMKAEQIAVLWKKILKRFEAMAVEKNLTESVISLLRSEISSKPELPPPLPQTERMRCIVRFMKNERSDLFRTGEEEDEARLRLISASSTYSRDEMMTRLRQFHNFMTNRKAHNMLLEFPSKRLILHKIRDLSDEEACLYFREHLELQESVAMDLVDSLRRMKDADLETGMIRSRMIDQMQARDAEMQIMIERAANRELKIQKQRMTRAVAMANAQEDPEKAMEAVNRKVDRLVSRVEKAQRLVHRREQAVAAAREELNKAKRESRRLEALVRVQRAASNDARALSELKTITPQDRCDWIHRYTHCQKLPERDNRERRAKYGEILSVLSEFKRVSETYAKIIVAELYMPEGRKLLNIKSKKRCDLESHEKLVWELRNIRFVVALDYNGMYNGSDAAAMKAAGNALRASREYARYVLEDKDCEDICVPLSCNFDYMGFRVTCKFSFSLTLNLCVSFNLSSSHSSLSTTISTTINSNSHIQVRQSLLSFMRKEIRMANL